MLQKITMPKLGQTMEEGILLSWRVKEGDYVRKGDILFEVETDKAVMEVESFVEGRIKRILAKEGETIPIHQVMAIVGEETDEIPEEAEDVSEPAESIVSEISPEQPKPDRERGGKILASPRARLLAGEKGVDISLVQGTGPNGRIESKDVENYLAQAEIAPKITEKVVPLSPIRRIIAEKVVQSKQTIPHFYLTTEVDMNVAVRVRKEYNEKGDLKVSFNDLLIKACIEAFRKVPEMNVAWEGTSLRHRGTIAIGLAIDTPEGVFIAVLKDVAGKTLPDIARQSSALISRARDQHLTLDEMSGASLTISNLGMYEVDSFIPVINPGEAAILGVGKIADRPLIREGSLFIVPTVKLTMSVDHRIIDGARAAAFLSEIKRWLENSEINY